MSDHQWIRQHLAWYVNGTLVGEEYAKVHQHLSECVICQQEHVQLQRLSQSVGEEAALLPNSASALADLQPQLAVSSKARVLFDFMGLLSRSPAGIRYLVAVQAAALAIMAGFLLLAGSTGDVVPGYTTLSSDNKNDGDVRLVFSHMLSEQERNSILHSHGLELVGRPTDRGIATARWSTQHQQKTLESLRAQPGIELAEPIGTGFKAEP